MKLTRAEKLADHLTELDGDLLSTAYEIDNAEKLARWKKYSLASVGKPTRLRWLAVIAASLLVLFIAGALIYQQNIPISRVQASYVFDVFNPQEVVGMADYVFIGYVDSKDGTEHLVPESSMGWPITVYTITVVENIKGELITDEPIQVYKDGGLARDRSCICLYEGDTLPEEGKLYLFSAMTGETGQLSCSGPNSSIPLSDEPISQRDFAPDAVELSDSALETVAIYRTALENEIVYNRDRYLSIYDASGKDFVIGTPVETAKPLEENGVPQE